MVKRRFHSTRLTAWLACAVLLCVAMWPSVQRMAFRQQAGNPFGMCSSRLVLHQVLGKNAEPSAPASALANGHCSLCALHTLDLALPTHPVVFALLAFAEPAPWIEPQDDLGVAQHEAKQARGPPFFV